MNKMITRPQFLSLLLIGDAFMLFCLKGSISAVTVSGYALGSLLMFLLTLPIPLLRRRDKDFKSFGKLPGIIVLALVLIHGGALFSMLWSTSEVIYIPFEQNGIWGKLLIAAIAALVCVYISSSGIKALARSGVIAAAVGAICIVVVTVSAMINSEPENLLIRSDNSFLRELLRGISLGSLGSFAALICFLRDDPLESSAAYFLGRTILSAVMLLTGVLVTGGIMKITDFPIVSAAQLSQPFPVQRIDSLFLIVFSVFAVYAIAVQAAAAEYLLGVTVPKLKKYRCTLMLAVMAIIGTML